MSHGPYGAKFVALHRGLPGECKIIEFTQASDTPTLKLAVSLAGVYSQQLQICVAVANWFEQKC